MAAGIDESGRTMKFGVANGFGGGHRRLPDPTGSVLWPLADAPLGQRPAHRAGGERRVPSSTQPAEPAAARLAITEHAAEREMGSASRIDGRIVCGGRTAMESRPLVLTTPP